MRVLGPSDVVGLLLEPALPLGVHVDVEGEALFLWAEDPQIAARVVLAAQLGTRRPPRLVLGVRLAAHGCMRLAYGWGQD